MKNLKRVLAILTAFVMLFGTIAFAAPADVEGTDFEEAAARLGALGIMKGDDAGFRPNDSIKRSEFAAVVVRALGYEDAVKAAAGTTAFADVEANHWAAGYINVASGLNIINGYGNGNFGPDDNVTYEQAVTMIVRALDYEEVAKASGGYPIGYLVVAAEEDITEDAEGDSGTAASRGIVANLVDNALEVPMMVQVEFGSDTKWVKSGTKDYEDEVTLLDSKLKLDKYEAEVLAVKDNEIEVKTTSNEDNGKDKNKKFDFELFEGLEFVAIENSIVELWVKDDVVYSIKDESEVVYDFIDEVNGSDAKGGTEKDDVEEITLKRAKDEYDVHEDWKAYYNGEAIGSSDEFNLANHMGVDDKIVKFIINDSKIIRVDIFKLTELGLITEIDAEQIEYTKGENTGRKLKDLDDADSMEVIIDREIASYDDLEEDMYVAYHEEDDDYIIAASSKKAEGELEKIFNNKLRIGDIEKDLAATYYFSTDEGDEYEPEDGGAKEDFGDFYDEDIVAYMNIADKFVYVRAAVTESSKDFYGYVTSAWKTNKEYLEIFRDVDGKGEELSYELDLDYNPTKLADIDDSLVMFAQIHSGTNIPEENGTAITAIEYTPSTIESVFKFTVNGDNEITEIEVIDWEAFSAGQITEFEEDDDYIETNKGTKRNFYVDDDTVFFNLGDTNDPELVKWEDFNTKGSSDAAMSLQDHRNTDVGIFTAGYDDITGEDTFVAYVEKEYGVSGDDIQVEMITQEGEERVVKIDEDDAKDVDLEKKRFIIYTEDGDDRINIKDKDDVLNFDDTSDWTSVEEEVYEIDGTRHIIFVDPDVTGNENKWMRLDKEVLVFEVNPKGTRKLDGAELSSLGEINTRKNNDGDSDVVYYYAIDDVIRAIFFVPYDDRADHGW